MEVKIKSCPFCGSLALRMIRTEDHGFWWVECKDCEISGPQSEQIDHRCNVRSREEALALWNKRHRVVSAKVSLPAKTRGD